MIRLRGTLVLRYVLLLPILPAPNQVSNRR
jgi:hypothetical protein